jgi:hypothetical protein
MQKSKASKKPALSFQDRLRGYERDKRELLAAAATISTVELSDRLKDLSDKWRI